MRYIIKYYEVVNNMYVIVVKLWANIMLHWPTPNRLNSKHETLNWIGMMLGQYRRRSWANNSLPLDKCLMLAEIQSPHNPSCVQGVLVFPLHPARYDPVSTYLGPHSRRTHVPLVRHPPSLDIKANRNAPAIRRHRLAWEHQAKWEYTRSDATTWPTLFQHCDSVDDNDPTLRQHCILAICELLFVQPITQL